MIRTVSCSALFLLFSLGCANQGDDTGFVLEVEAGSFDRIRVLTGFEAPAGLQAGDYSLVDEEGSETPLQIGRDGIGYFVLDSLSAGASRSYQVRAGKALGPEVSANRRGGALDLEVEGKPVLSYHFEKTAPPREEIRPIFARGGYIHPVQTPAGLVITDDYPHNHVHHHGIWAAWTSTEFEGRRPDFWNMGAETGTVEPVALDDTWSGRVHGGFRARHAYIDLSPEEPKTVLDEEWEVRVYNPLDDTNPFWLFDLEKRQQCATESELKLPEYRYGGVGFRGSGDWDGEENTVFLTSEGKTRIDGHATRARWCHIGGRVGGQMAGVSILDHPSNFQAPQPMRIHPSEPFFNYAPSQAGDFAIRPGETYTARYRFVVYDGEPDPGLLNRLWKDYANPPLVRLKR
jgi:hypothetical protein